MASEHLDGYATGDVEGRIEAKRAVKIIAADRRMFDHCCYRASRLGLCVDTHDCTCLDCIQTPSAWPLVLT